MTGFRLTEKRQNGCSDAAGDFSGEASFPEWFGVSYNVVQPLGGNAGLVHV